MLVKFVSTESGELFMNSDLAALVLHTLGKSCSARGVITYEQIAPALAALHALSQATPELKDNQDNKEAEEDGKETPQEPPVRLQARLWPVLQMLERTQKGKPDGFILWEAAKDF